MVLRRIMVFPSRAVHPTQNGVTAQNGRCEIFYPTFKVPAWSPGGGIEPQIDL